MKIFSAHALLTSILLTGVISPNLASAEDKIVFRPVAEDTESARAVCRSKRVRSASSLSKQSYRFRGYIDPNQLRDIINGRQSMTVGQIVSAANPIVFGGDTLAEVKLSEISIEIKSVIGKSISEILFRWSNEDPSMMEELSDAREDFSFVDQGTPECRLSGPRFSTNTCQYDAEEQAEELLAKHLKRLSDDRIENGQKSMSEGIMIEVLYRTESYADCIGRNAIATVRTRASRPVLRLSH